MKKAKKTEWKHFGTDGVRGIVGETFTTDYISKIAHATVAGFRKRSLNATLSPKKVVIGWDTRRSCDFIVDIFAGVLAGHGVEVIKVGVVPTAGLSFLTGKLSCDIGVMVSASHNDFRHNGIKLFSPTGEKMDDETTGEIDSFISAKYIDNSASVANSVGRIMTDTKAINLWQKYLIRKFKRAGKNNSQTAEVPRQKIAVDCAFGSGAECAEAVLKSLGYDTVFFNTEADGLNINKNCGATVPAYLSSVIKEHEKRGNGFTVGFAFDGDADRCVAFDENGDVINGDILIAELAKFRSVKDVVATIMFNLGVEQGLKEAGISLIRTPVGDRYIYKVINDYNLLLGGETSGHIIFNDIWRSGDGLLTALVVLQALFKKGIKASELGSGFQVYPHTSKNIPVTREQKKKVEEIITTKDGYKTIVRPSGTEDLVRITVEGPDLRECENKLQIEVYELQKQIN